MAFFTIIYKAGEEVRRRLLKVCEVHQCNFQEITENSDSLLAKNDAKVKELEEYLKITKDSIISCLKELASPGKGGESSYLKIVEIFIAQEQMIYSTINLMKSREKTF